MPSSFVSAFARRLGGAVRGLVPWARAHRLWLVCLVALLAVTALPNLPGRWNTDTGVMIEQMRTGRYDDVWAPFVIWLWTPLYRLGLGPGFVLVGQVTALFAAIGAILLRVGVRPRWAPVLTTVVCLNPIVYTASISVMRDTWFLAAALGAVAVALGPRRRSAMVFAVLLCLLAVASRQNAAPAMVVIAAVAARRWWPEWRWWRVGVLAVAVPLVQLGVLMAWEAVAGVQQEHPESAVYLGDLDEMSTRVGEVLIPAAVADPPFTLDELATSSIYALDTLWFYDQRASLRQPAQIHAEIAAAWRAAVREHPVVYLHGRWQLFTRQIGWSGPPRIAFFPHDISSRYMPTPWFPGAASASSTYLGWFTPGGTWEEGGFLHRAWWWWAATLALAGVAWRTRWRGVALAAAGFVTVHLGVLFVAAPHGQYRFVEAAIVVAQVTLVAAGALAAAAAGYPRRMPRTRRSTAP